MNINEKINQALGIRTKPINYRKYHPVISPETMQEHHGQHYKKYVKKTKELNKHNATIQTLLKTATGELYNNAAQVFNHELYWKSMALDTNINDRVRELLTEHFGGILKFKNEWIEKSLNHFGSGWCWLIKRRNKLIIKTTTNASCPKDPIICMDLWEHAYYLDFKSDKEGYARKWVNRLLNWDMIRV
jgi:Fe-Mn family superoxide dismutase